MDEMVRQMHTTMNDMFEGSASGQMAIPISDVFEEGGKLIVHMHIAGLTEDELDINVENNILTVKGERTVSEEDNKKRTYLMRESSLQVYRRMALPKSVDSEKIEAHLEDGVLRLEIPKKAEAESKKIAVKAKRALKK
jgi:HSP20 family protein